jgi:hypothetical protein
MRTRITALALTATAAILAAGLSAASSSALTAPPPWTITPGGSFSATHIGSITFKDTSTATILTCTHSHGAGTLLAGSSIPGPVLGSLSTLIFTGCTGPLGLLLTVTAHALPWTLDGMSYNAGVTHGKITGIDITLTGTNAPCSMVLDRTAAGADNGTADVTYKNTTQKLALQPAGGTLHSWAVTPQCDGLFNTGDPVAVTATYTLTPLQSIS